MKRAFALPVLLGLALAAAGCGEASSAPASQGGASAAAKAAPASGGQLTPIKIAYSQVAAAFAQLWMAQDGGYFKKYGLDAQVIHLAPPTDIQTVISGEMEFVVDGASGVGAITGGANLTFIAVPLPIFTQSIYAQPSIQSAKDLIGKNLGATVQGSSGDNALKTYLLKEGIDRNRVHFVYLRDDAAVLAALQSGQIQASVLTSPNTLRAKQAGLRELSYLPDLKLETVNQGINVRKDWAQQHPDVVLSFLRGWVEGAKQARTDAAATKAIISKYAELTDPAQLDDTYKTARSGWAAYPLPQDSQFQNVIALSPDQKVKAHKPSDFYDGSYLEQLDGFVNSLYPEGVPTQ
jgi:ABC-type nitrate/sulfonate/bicarbonate transport system substrate-binding protein